MTIEEFEKKLKISKNTCIHCPTLELAKQVLSIFNQLGLKWLNEKHYTTYTNWDKHEENTLYYPFDGLYYSLKFADLTGYKVISAEEFILLHTEKEKFDLENYIPKGDLIGFPKEIIARMLECQEEQNTKRDVSVFEKQRTVRWSHKGFDWNGTKEGWYFWNEVISNKDFNLFFEKYPKQDYLANYIPKGDLTGFPKEIIVRMLNYQEEQGNPRDVTIFEKRAVAKQCIKGFDWGVTREDWDFWHEVITNKDFNLFFEKYPKKDNRESKIAKYVQIGNNAILSDYTSTQSSVEIEINTTEEDSQEFRVGDEVFDIILGQKGKILQISTDDNSTFPMYVSFNEGQKTYTLDGRYYRDDKYPRLLHYRDDYDYDVIDFNNLPKRQEPKRWRAKKGEIYYRFTSNFEVIGFYDDNDFSDNRAYDSGNYFQTEKEAQEVADKLNKYFQELLNTIK